MPSVCLGEVKNRSLWFKGFEQTYLERDVRELSQVGNIISFRNLLHLAALRTGQFLSPSQLGRDAKLNAVTTSRYLSLLEASFIIQRISPYLKNRAGRLIKSPKLYISDSGLACYLSGIDSAESELVKGAMFETYVAQNLSGIIDMRWPEVNLYFWHVQGRYEVDFVIEAGNRCLAIEVKSAARWVPLGLSPLNLATVLALDSSIKTLLILSLTARLMTALSPNPIKLGRSFIIVIFAGSIFRLLRYSIICFASSFLFLSPLIISASTCDGI